MADDRNGRLMDILRSNVEPGTSVLVSGPVHGGQFGLCLDVLAGDPGESTGAVLVSTDTRAGTVRSEFRRRAGTDAPLFVVDARSGGAGEGGSDGPQVRTVSSPSDLTGIGIGVVNGLDALQRRGAHRAGLGVDSVSTLVQYLDVTTVFKFLHTVTGRCAATDVTCVGTLNAPVHDERTVNLVASAFDVHVRIREDEDGNGFEARVLGLPAGPTEWLPAPIR
jgi:KaiC/GvpD/RAD55 family RecA-like ATPase